LEFITQEADVLGAIVAKTLPLTSKTAAKYCGAQVLAQLFDHVHKDIDGRRGQAAERVDMGRERCMA